MEPVTIAKFISLGSNIRYLQDAVASRRVHEPSTTLDIIDNILIKLKEYGFVVTLGATRRLILLRERLAKTSEDYLLTATDAQELKNIALILRNTLLAEAGGKVAYIVTDKRLDVNKLMRDVPSLFPPNIFKKLPKLARYDFEQSARCIAFGLATAAAFHMLRGTEAILREFYKCYVRKNRMKLLLWAPMVDSLTKLKKPPPTELLNYLTDIRKSYRNPTDHPDKIYDIHEAQTLWDLCVNVCGRMSTVIAIKRKK